MGGMLLNKEIAIILITLIVIVMTAMIIINMLQQPTLGVGV